MPVGELHDKKHWHTTTLGSQSCCWSIVVTIRSGNPRNHGLFFRLTFNSHALLSRNTDFNEEGYLEGYCLPRDVRCP